MNKKKIVVGIDTRDLKVAKTGQKTVLEELCRQFKKDEYERVSFVFFDTALPPYTGTNKYRLLFEHLRYQFWKQVILPLKAWHHHCDVVFCTDYFIPYIHLGFETVEIFHDAFFFEYPGHYNKNWLKIFHGIAMPAARKCAYIVTMTDYARGQLHKYAKFPLEKLVTIHLASKSFEQKKVTDKKPLAIPADVKYLLHVGVMEKRKNLPRLVQAFRELKNSYSEPVKLVLVGKGNGKIYSDDYVNVKKSIADNGLGQDVFLPGYLPDEELSYVYQHAYAYVFPSVNEGFGIPVLEAFRWNLPVLAANNSSLPEVGGDAVLLFDPLSTEDIANKMRNVLESPELYHELREKGKQRLKDFSWKKTADQFVQVFEAAYHDKNQ